MIFLEGNPPAECLLNRMYRGYTMTPVGSLVGAVWGFIDAGIGGAVFVWLYNLLSERISKTQ